MYHQLNKLLVLPLLVAILTCTACSTTETQQQQVAPAENPVDKDGLPILTDEQKDAGIICVREPVTGTRISKKSCTTREQRENAQRLSQEDLINSQRRQTSSTISDGG